MVESSQSKKKLFYLIVLILTFITMLISATIAYFSLISSQKEEDTTLYTGTLQINYIDGVYLKDPELIPKKSISLNTYDNVYRNNFAVSSSGTLDQTISVDLIISKNEFGPTDLKYTLFSSNGKQLSTGYVPKEGETVTVTNDMFLAHGDTARYTLIIWLSNTNFNQNNLMGNTITGRINVHAVQMKY